jgi:hypothetical protein
MATPGMRGAGAATAMRVAGTACSDAERRLAVAVHDDLRARGHEAWVEAHWVRPRRDVALALGCAGCAIGGLVAIGAPVAGLVATAFAALCVGLDVAGRASPLRLLLPRRATQVVLVAPSAGDALWTGAAGGDAPEAPPVDLLLVARTDAPRAGVARRLARVPGGLAWLAVAALAVTAAAAARAAGAEGTLLGALQLAPTVVLLAAATAALDAAVARPGDGGPETEALAAALAAHAALVRDAPAGVATGLVLAGPDALRAHLRRERLDPARTALLHVRPGAARSRHPQWRAALLAAGLAPRRDGPRGVPAAEVPPGHAEAVARALKLAAPRG